MQFVCRPTLVDDLQGKAEILTAQLADFQPERRHADVDVESGRYARMLPGIRGVRLSVQRVEAKFKYDDHTPVERRERRRLPEVGEWRAPQPTLTNPLDHRDAH